jgi:hypothetical protein
VIGGKELSASECLSGLRAYKPKAITLSAGHFHIYPDTQAILAKSLELGYDGIEAGGPETEVDHIFSFLGTLKPNSSPISFHLPLPLDPEALVKKCLAITSVSRFVLHPEKPEILPFFRPLGPLLLLENLDSARDNWRSVEEMKAVFEEVPEARLCLDIAHAERVDPSLTLAHELIEAFPLGQLHISRLAEDCWHLPLTDESLERYDSLLKKAAHVPWIIEAPFSDGPCDPYICERCLYGREDLFL